MDAHGVEVLNRADHHGVVGVIAHHLQLEFLPAHHGFFHQRFVHGAEFETVANLLFQLFAVVSHARARPAQGERRSDDEREPHLLGKLQRRLQLVHQNTLRHVEADLLHGVLEPEPVLGHLNGVERGADQLHVVLVENALFCELDGKIERRLPAYRRQQGVGLLARDDGFEIFPGKRLDVSAVGKLRVGHDGGRIGIHQHHLVALGLQGLAGLRAGIVKLAPLADDDRAGTNDQDFV